MLVSIVTITKTFPEIWDSFQTPEHVDRDVVLQNIVIECAELELVYSDPDALQKMIDVWTRKNLPVWKSLQDTLEYKYNPIWNVEGSETETIDRTNNEDRDLTNIRTPNLTTSGKVAGYNSNELQQRDEVTETGSDQNRHTGNVDNKEHSIRTLERGMNLGVMTTQQLIREQRDLVQFTVADYITHSFKEHFTIMVY